MIELNKALMGQTIDEWIRFFNVRTEGDLDMLRMQTKNAGILEAIKEIEHMSLSRWAKAQYEEHMKCVMDRKAEDAYVYDRGVEAGIERGIEQGMEQGIKKGIKKGIEQGRTDIIVRMYRNGLSVEQIAAATGEHPDEVKRLLDSLNSHS